MLCIYRRPGRYVVKKYTGDDEGLWAVLGPKYTRESAQALADSLTQELEEAREAKKRK